MCFCDKRQPNIPTRPKGQIFEKPQINYEFQTSAIDPDGGDIRYGWDWNGDKKIDEWTGFYHQGIKISTTHSWQNNGI